MDKIDLYHYERNRKYPASYLEAGEKIIFSFGNMPKDAFYFFLDQVKGLENARWNPEDKTWTFRHPNYSGRNRFVLGYLTNGTFPGCLTDPYGPYLAPYIDYISDRPLREAQIEMVKHILTRRRALIAAEMGLGKTLSTIEAMEYIQKHVLGHDMSFSHTNYFWIIGPLAALRSWNYELQKWQSLIRPRLISCDQAIIKRAMREAKHPPLFLCIDESSRFKNAKAKRTQLALELSRLMEEYWRGDEYLIGMSGSPSPRNPIDWWAQAEIARPGYLKEKSPAKMQDTVALTETQEGPHGSYKKIVGFKQDEVQRVYRRLKGLTLVQLKKDYLDLPDKVYRTIHAEVSQETLRLAQMIVHNSERTIDALMKLRQLSDGFQYSEESTKRYPCPKDDLLREILEEFTTNDKSRIVIYAGFTESVDKCVDICLDQGWKVIRVDGRGWEGFETEASMEQFQDRDLDVPIAFVGNAAAGGIGLTLTSSDTIVYFSNSFNAEDRIQSEDRIHRMGMGDGANIVDLIHLPTDEIVLTNLREKKALQKLTLGELLTDIEKVLIL